MGASERLFDEAGEERFALVLAAGFEVGGGEGGELGADLEDAVELAVGVGGGYGGGAAGYYAVGRRRC